MEFKKGPEKLSFLEKRKLNLYCRILSLEYYDKGATIANQNSKSDDEKLAMKTVNF